MRVFSRRIAKFVTHSSRKTRDPAKQNPRPRLCHPIPLWPPSFYPTQRRFTPPFFLDETMPDACYLTPTGGNPGTSRACSTYRLGIRPVLRHDFLQLFSSCYCPAEGLFGVGKPPCKRIWGALLLPGTSEKNVFHIIQPMGCFLEISPQVCVLIWASKTDRCALSASTRD